MNVHKPVVIRPKTIITSFGYTSQLFSCEIRFLDRVRMLFSKTIWIRMHGSQINRLAQGMSHNGLPKDDVGVE